ncbi:MAG: methionine adenosyltransferase [Candidatus Coatesbacteria bacterium]|nr:methionine adenosyltransferase [Candidatus Coatesbacteria bacterium]
MVTRHHFFTSESVTEGHPDKVADQISDGVLDEALRKDLRARVACETMVTTGMAFITGEITVDGYVDIPKVVRETVRRIGYTDARMGFDHHSIGVMSAIDEQSPDIAQGVNEEGAHEQGAGDQGLMFGYATTETPELMPLTISLAHRLAERLSEVRKREIIPHLRPDGKSQVTIEYENGAAKRVSHVVIAAQHDEKISEDELRELVKKHVVGEVVDSALLDANTDYLINGTGQFILGGPQADTGLTGRKIIVDTYGGHGAHGGGCFSGKDPSKVDRSASYMARYIAKNIVAAGLAEQVELQLAYCIGMAQPVSVLVNSYGTAKIDEGAIEAAVRKVFDLRPKAIIERLDLLRPIYQKTAAYGHFGRELPEFTWERTDAADDLKNAV